MDDKLLSICLFITLLFRGASARPSNIVKRETDEKNINDVFSRFTKGSKGWASYYGEYPVGTGACSLDPMPPVFTQKNWIKVAAGEPDFQKGLGCGTCLKIEASGKPVAKGNKALKGTYYAVINDLCGACGQGDLDFYTKEVFDGKWEITFDAVDCPDVSGPKGNIQYRFSGSNPWYLKLQITNSKLPTAAVEFFNDGKWHCAKRASDNHFIMSGLGEMKFPMKARLTSIAGETVGGDIPKLENDKDQDSGKQYKSFKSAAGSSPPKLPCHGQGGLKRPGKPEDTDSQGQEGGGSKGGDENGPTDGKEGEKVVGEKGGDDKGGSKDGEKGGDDKGGEKGGDDKGGEKGGDDKGGSKDGEKGGDDKGGEKGGDDKGSEKGGDDKGGEKGGDDKGGEKGGDDKGGEKGGEKDGENKSFCKDKEPGIYANPDDCKTFYQCANGQTYKKDCPPGLHFNEKIKSCDYPKNAGCSKGGSSGNDEQKDEKKQDSKSKESLSQIELNKVIVNWCHDENLKDGRHAHPDDCRKFINCSQGKIGYYRCPDGYNFDRKTENCEKSEFVDCKDRPVYDKTRIDLHSSPQVSDKDDKSLSAHESAAGVETESGFCRGKLEGRYPVKSQCNAFYRCIKDSTLMKTCPPGLKFNPQEAVCDWPKHVDCEDQVINVA